MINPEEAQELVRETVENLKKHPEIVRVMLLVHHKSRPDDTNVSIVQETNYTIEDLALLAKRMDKVVDGILEKQLKAKVVSPYTK